MEVNKQFNQCPNCGSTERFLESLAGELKEQGYARKNWVFGFDFREGVVIDPVREAFIPIGTRIPAFRITTDICLNCGTIYAVSIESGTAAKQIVPQIIKPGTELIGNDPRFS